MVLDGGSRAVPLDASPYHLNRQEQWPLRGLAVLYKHGSDYVKSAEEMIKKDIRVNNEFYVCPVFNQAIADDKKIYTHTASKMWGLGTPEDLRYYLENFKS